MSIVLSTAVTFAIWWSECEAQCPAVAAFPETCQWFKVMAKWKVPFCFCHEGHTATCLFQLREYSWCWHKPTEHQLYSWSCRRGTATVYCLLGAKTRKVQLQVNNCHLQNCHSLLCSTAHLKWTDKEVPSTSLMQFQVRVYSWLKTVSNDDDALEEMNDWWCVRW